MRSPQEARVEAIVGDLEHADFSEGVERFCAHLKRHLALPCEVTGCEDFDWEEFYVIGPGSGEEHKRLRRTQPSFRDRYDLLAIDTDASSQWMLYFDEDIGALCRRKSDGREFVLGLAELKTTDPKHPNSQLIEDYGFYFVNCR